MTDRSSVALDALAQRRASLIDEADRVAAELGRKLDPDWEEQASELEGAEVLEAREAGLRESLRDIDLAIQRVKSGHYGMCTVCGAPIGEQRLKAKPEATTCIGCATEADRK